MKLLKFPPKIEHDMRRRFSNVYKHYETRGIYRDGSRIVFENI